MIIFGVVLCAVIGFYQNGIFRTIQGGTVGFITFIVLFYFGKLLMPYLANLRQIDLVKQAISKNDVLLGLILGLLLGWSEIMNGLLFTFIILGIAGLLITFYMIAIRKYNPNLSVPLGPFIALGGIISFFIDINF
jgi:hypothetical protein